MTVLSVQSLRNLCRSPYDMVTRKNGSVAFRPVSVDVHLHAVGSHDGRMTTSESWLSVVPGVGAFLLGETEEYFRMPENVMGMVVGKSSVGRMGMMAECAGLIDPGFEGTITLELANLLPVSGLPLERGMPIAQVFFMWLDEPTNMLYGDPGAQAHYQGQTGPTVSHLLGQ